MVHSIAHARMLPTSCAAHTNLVLDGHNVALVALAVVFLARWGKTAVAGFHRQPTSQLSSPSGACCRRTGALASVMRARGAPGDHIMAQLPRSVIMRSQNRVGG
jgi:hypothetical protein